MGLHLRHFSQVVSDRVCRVMSPCDEDEHFLELVVVHGGVQEFYVKASSLFSSHRHGAICRCC